MSLPTYDQMLKAGVHFGHQKRKWNPKMKQFIFMEKKGIHIIDLNKTTQCMKKAGNALQKIATSGKKILFVATKKQAKEKVAKIARSANMPYVTERWLGGMMTNFATVRRSIRKMNMIDKMLTDKNATNITKKERLTLTRERNKIEKVMGGIANLNRLPGALFVVDIHHEHLAISEAKKLGMKVFGIVDTNSNPELIDFPIPANDDSSKSINVIVEYIGSCIKTGLEERNNLKKEKTA